MSNPSRILYFSFLSAEQIRIGKEVLTVEIASTHASRARGLMGRKQLADGHGMLFIYEEEQLLVFWMKETLIPLSIAFFDKEKKVIHTLDMDPPVGKHLIKYKSTAPALYALEVPQGWFERHGIERGMQFSFLDPSNQIQ